MKVFLVILAVVSCVLAKDYTPAQMKLADVLIRECVQEAIIQDPIYDYSVCVAKAISFIDATDIANETKVVMQKEEIKLLAHNCVAKYFKYLEDSDRDVLDCLRNGVTAKKA